MLGYQVQGTSPLLAYFGVRSTQGSDVGLGKRDRLVEMGTNQPNSWTIQRLQQSRFLYSTLDQST